MPRTTSVSTGQSQSGVDRVPEKQAKADPNVLARCLQKVKENRKISVMHRETEWPEFEGLQFGTIYEQN